MRVLMIVLEGATPGIVSPLIDRGELPHLSGIIERGCVGTLDATPPFVRSMASTALATGQSAPAHGVYGDVTTRLDGAGIDRTGRRAWRARALWEALAETGQRCAIVGWPATAPATGWASGLLIDDTFAEASGPGFDAWPLLPECISPREWRNGLRELRVHPGDITGEQIVGLVPHAKRVDQDNDPRLTRVAVALARSSTIHAAATHIAAEYAWDFLAVSYPLLADIQAEFLRFRSPQLPDVDTADIEIFGSVVDIAYRVQDAMLGTLMRAVDEKTTIIVLSPFGFACGPDRPDARAAHMLPLSISWHRPGGVLAAAGPNIPSDALLHGAHLEDVGPTVLALFGLRVPEHQGRCIQPIATLEGSREVSLGAREPETLESQPGEAEPEQRDAIERTRLTWLANAAEAHFALGRYDDAAARYAQIVERLPEDWLAKARLARCALHLNDLERCRTLAAEIVQTQPDLPWGYLLGAAGLVLGGDAANAEALLLQAGDKGRNLPNLALKLGILHLLCKDFRKAEELFRDSLETAPASVEAYDGLGCALVGQARYEEAVNAFRAGLGCSYRYSLAHLHLGIALAELGRWEEAHEAAQTAVNQEPAIPGGEALLERVRTRIQARSLRAAMSSRSDVAREL